jgi:hypothetical protein
MKRILVMIASITLQVVSVHGMTFPEEIETSFRKYGRRMPGRDDLYGEQKEFVDYITSNWPKIADNIESLPPVDGEDFLGNVRFNATVVHFGYACCRLGPIEYLDYFEQITALYEQKRISFTAFKNLYHGGYGKEDFWSVNWEHPGVQAIFERIRRFDPPPDASFMEMVEDQSAGKLADNYMVNRGDNDPLPQTLPGIKLQRPFASLIRKYEAMTGKKFPPDPEFPDHHITRPSKRGLREIEAAGTASVSPPVGRKGWVWISVAGMAFLLLLGMFRRRWRRAG